MVGEGDGAARQHIPPQTTRDGMLAQTKRYPKHAGQSLAHGAGRIGRKFVQGKFVVAGIHLLLATLNTVSK